MTVIATRGDGSELLNYNAPDYPLRTGESRLSVFADYAAQCHWHRDFEAFVALDNDMDYRVNGRHVALSRGDGLLVNSRRLHYGYSQRREECQFCFAVFHPMLMGASAPVASLLEQLSSDESPDYWHLRADTAEGRRGVALILAICGHGAPASALSALSECAALLSLVADTAKPVQTVDPAWDVIRRMVGFIQEHYRDHLFLEDIAAAGMVCRSRCCALFRDKLGMTPMGYVTDYRLGRACMLQQSGKSITEAALTSGFQSVSFFSETFKKHYGMTPTAYMKRLGQSTLPDAGAR